MNNDNKTMALVVATMLKCEPGTLKHTRNLHDDKIEITCEIKGKKYKLVFSQYMPNLFLKADGKPDEVRNIKYEAAGYVNDVRAFACQDITLDFICQTFAAVKKTIKAHEYAYLSEAEAYNLMMPYPKNAFVQVGEPKGGDEWDKPFGGHVKGYHEDKVIVFNELNLSVLVPLDRIVTEI